MSTRTVYTWHLTYRRPDPPHKATDPGISRAPWSTRHTDGGPYSTHNAAFDAGRRAAKQLEELHPSNAGLSPEIREHTAPVTQATVDETFPRPDAPTRRTAYLMTILRPADGSDCTARGESSRAVRLLAVVDGELFTEPGPFDPDSPRNTLPVFVVSKTGGRHNLRPESAGKSWCMFGGNFAHSCDSRTPSHPIPIHDRIEA